MTSPRRKKIGQLEELLNGELARLLSSLEIPAEPEWREKGKRMDIVADVNGLRVVVEAETGFHRKQTAVADADARLKQGLTNVVLAVCYPDNSTVASLPTATFTWTVRTKAGAPADTWATGSVAELAQAIRQSPYSLSGADIAAQMLSDGLDAAVQRLTYPVRKALAQTLDLPSDKGGDYFTAAKRGMLVVATAMLFHHRLEEHLPALRPSGFMGDWPPLSAKRCAGDPNAVISAFSHAWISILAVDYKPVFMTGRIALNALPANPDSAQAVYNLSQVVERIAEHVHGLRHDLLGRIFHRVLDTARYDGSFYTSTAAAVLLATLALREEEADWSDPNSIGNLRVCDPACGTGTLLMAVAERIRDLRHAAGPIAKDDEDALALCMVEDVLWGIDCNLTATHMAASTLGMLSPSTQFSRMNIQRAYLGVQDGAPYLGSLEILDGNLRLIGWPYEHIGVGDEYTEASLLPPPMDLVIMNPPFTRNSIRHNQFSKSEEEALQRREAAIVSGYEFGKAIDLVGSSTAFSVLGERMLKENGGNLALVLPAVIPTGPSGKELRKFLGAKFHIEVIVSSHDPSRIFFSENTSIGEVLLICRRKDNETQKPPTRVVKLTRNPSTPVEALAVAAQIRQSIDTTGNFSRSNQFVVQHVPSSQITEGDWFAVNFLQQNLTEQFRKFVTNTDDSIPFIMLGEIAEVGPEGRRIRDAYTHTDMPSASGRRAVWHGRADVMNSMRAHTGVFIEPKNGMENLANRYWAQRSRLLLPGRMRLNTSKVSSILLDAPAVGSAYVPCRLNGTTIAQEEALCLYLNSTIGLLALLGGRNLRIPSYPWFSLDAMRAIPVPDFDKLGAGVVNSMSASFMRLRNELLQPFPRMNDDPIRRQIDDAVGKEIGADSEWVATIRRALSEEPSVTDRRYGE